MWNVRYNLACFFSLNFEARPDDLTGTSGLFAWVFKVLALSLYLSAFDWILFCILNIILWSMNVLLCYLLL